MYPLVGSNTNELLKRAKELQLQKDPYLKKIGEFTERACNALNKDSIKEHII